MLELPLVGARPALPEIALTLMEVEARDHPVAVEGDVITEPRGKLRIWLHAIERAVELRGDRTFVHQVKNVGLDAGRGVEAGETE